MLRLPRCDKEQGYIAVSSDHHQTFDSPHDKVIEQDGVAVPISQALIIDDDPAIRRISQISLTRVAKWDVLVAASGPEGIGLLNNKIDVVLLDVMMPGMDGPTTLAQIKKSEFGRVPVIFITAKVMQHEVEQYLALGAAGVICKPFDPVTLANQVSVIVDSWIGSAT